ncbi:MAG: repeat-containing protein [Fibrobacteres bacterium]|nr:repeat-containing protein [Fibrobacterota bacterium]
MKTMKSTRFAFALAISIAGFLGTARAQASANYKVKNLKVDGSLGRGGTSAQYKVPLYYLGTPSGGAGSSAGYFLRIPATPRHRTGAVSQGPSVVITRPAGDTVVLVNSLTVLYTVNGTPGSQAFSLVEGLNTLIVTASDGLGHTGADTAYVTYAIVPSITSQPPARTILEGQTATFTMAATGTAPLAYQWRLDGFDIAGATSASLTTPIAGLSDNGRLYSCAVSNAGGQVVSNNGQLIVNPVAPSLTRQPASVSVLDGDAASFSVTAAGSLSLTYQWRRNGTNIAGATGFAYTTPALNLSNNGNAYSVVVTNAAGSATSSNAVLTVAARPAGFTVHPAPISIFEGQSAVYSVVAVGTAPLTLQWRRNGVNIAGATGSSYTTPPASLTDSGANFSCVATNASGTVPSFNALLAVKTIPPAITSFLSNDVFFDSYGRITLSATASGSQPMTLTFVKRGLTDPTWSGVNLPSPTPGTGIADNLQQSDSGSYLRCIAANAAGSITSSEIQIHYKPNSPRVLVQPQPASVVVGDAASFSVVANGGLSLTYKWTRNAVDIPGATGASYTTPATTMADDGSHFQCVIQNETGYTFSTIVNLTVLAVAPAITQQPQPTTVTFGQPASFTVATSGTPPFAYKWRRDGIIIPGATTATYTIPATVMADSGRLFSAEITNSGATVTSATAILEVMRIAPVITVQPPNRVINWGQSAAFPVSVSGTAPFSYQWLRDGSPVAGAVSASYTLVNANESDNGAQFSCMVSNTTGSVYSNTGLLTVNPVAPAITAQPGSPAIFEGESAVFTVAATGTPYLNYQWRRAGVDILGATSPSFAYGPAALADNGVHFQCRITNATGGVTSADGILTVNPIAPVVTLQPVSKTAMAGHVSAFTVAASGSATLAYQWRKNGVDITGAASASYTTPAAVAGDNGAAFACRVSNAGGNVLSASAVLTIAATAPVARISAGSDHAAAVAADGRVWTWGTNSAGQLGQGSAPQAYFPDVVPGLANVSKLSVGQQFNLAVRADNTIWSWGVNAASQLGRSVAVIPAGTPGQITVAASTNASAGGSHGLALLSDGTVQGWGSNSNGQVGDNTSGNMRATPVAVSGLTGASQVSAGGQHSLALKSNGTVMAWGSNGAAQLGDNSFTDRPAPVAVATLTNITSVSAGGFHSLALKSDGSVWAWGWNQYGQIGNGTSGNWLQVPVQVPGLSGITAIAAGAGHSLALKSDGTVWAWGYNQFGQLGDGSTTNRSVPVKITGLEGVVSLAAGGNAGYAVRADGTYWAWGEGQYFQTASGGLADLSTPSAFTGIEAGPKVATPVLSIEGGNLAAPASIIVTCATPSATLRFTTDGSEPNAASTLLANGGSVAASAGLTTLKVKAFLTGSVASATKTGNYSVGPSFAAGSGHTAILEPDGRVWTVGQNASGQLGLGTFQTGYLPENVTGFAAAVQVGAGLQQTYASMSDGTVWSWGASGNGELGRVPGGIPQETAGPIPGLANVKRFSAGASHVLSLLGDGTVKAWGLNTYGQVGDGTSGNSISVPAAVSGLSGVMAVAAGGAHSLALRSDGRVWAWGSNSSYQLGITQVGQRANAMPVPQLEDVTGISAGSVHSLALKSDGTVWAWGASYEGQAGDGQPAGFRTAPVKVLGLANVAAIVSGYGHNLALKRDGTVWTWGLNDFGQLGDGNLVNSSRNTPQQVPGLTGVISIGAGQRHSFAVKADGSIWAWGAGTAGQLGDGFAMDRSSPTQIPSVDAMPRVALPVLSREGGPASAAFTLTVSNPTPGTDMHYTLNGTDPTQASTTIASGGTVSIGAGPTNFRVKAFKTGMLASFTKSAMFQVGASMAAGGDHSATLAPDGRVWTFGRNDQGQLGDGTLFQGFYAKSVPGLTGIVQAAAGLAHTVALKSDGTVWTWGANANNELGRSLATVPAPQPGQIAGFTSVSFVAAGYNHSLAVKTDGTLWTWGSNSNSQLGLGNTNPVSVPTRVPRFTNVVAAAGGEGHSLALTGEGRVWSWGLGTNGQIGNGSNAGSSDPVLVAGVSGIAALAAGGAHSLVLKADGTVWSWGSNNHGQLGTGPGADRSFPAQVPGLSGIVAIAAGSEHSLALKSDGTIWAWGFGNYGQLGDGLQADRNTPAQLAGVSGAVAISAGRFHSLVAKSDGSYLGWGNDGYSQLGDAGFNYSLTPIAIGGIEAIAPVAMPTVSEEGGKYPVALPVTIACATSGATIRYTLDGSDPTSASATIASGATLPIPSGLTMLRLKGFKSGLTASATKSAVYSVATGFDGGRSHSGAVNSEKRLWSWGGNSDGQLGDGSAIQSALPKLLANPANAFRYAGGGRFSLTVKGDGTVWSWGLNAKGQLGRTGTANFPGQIAGITTAKSVAAGAEFGLALLADGTVRAWGDNTFAQLGDGSTAQHNTPVPVSGLTRIVGIYAGESHALAVDQDGRVWVWGSNGYGQLGDGRASSNAFLPTSLGSLSGVIAVAAGSDFSAALKADGTVYTWGNNGAGQLGDGTNSMRTLPASVPGLTGVRAIEAGAQHMLALKSDGTIWAWGSNNSGDLGDGSLINRNAPVKVSGLVSMVSIGAGDYHSFGTQSDGTGWAWGLNDSAQAGDGGRGFRTLPVALLDFQAGAKVATPDVSLPGGSYPIAFSVTATCATVGADIHYTLDGSEPTVASTLISTGGAIAIPAGVTTLHVKAFLAGSIASSTRAANYAVGVGLAGGGNHTAGVSVDQRVWTWGTNASGQIGNGGTVTGFLPEALSLSGITRVASGTGFTLALKSDGTAWSWGDNAAGQLGRITATPRAPGQITGLANAKDLAAGFGHGLAATSSGAVYAWGNNTDGQIGDGTVGNVRTTPVAVPLAAGAVMVSAGKIHSLSLKADGTVYAWGGNAHGQLGSGDNNPLITPSPVPGIAKVAGIAAGWEHTLALKADGTVWSWGYGGYGQLGLGDFLDRNLPSAIPGLSNVVAVAAGSLHSLALKRDGTVWAWGANSSGQLGDPATTYSFVPFQVPGISGIVAISAGAEFSMAIKADGTQYAWGASQGYQLGDGINLNRASPVVVPSLPAVSPVAAPVVSVDGGMYNATFSVTISCATSGADLHYTLDGSDPTQGSTVIATGGALAIPAGITTLRVKAFKTGMLPAVRNANYAVGMMLDAGAMHGLAVGPDRRLWVWGRNVDGQLGNGAVADVLIPAQLSGYTDVIRASAGESHTLALRAAGTVWSWGKNEYGELGRATATPGTPGQIIGLTGIKALATTFRHSLALRTDGTVAAWGLGSQGQLGDGNSTNSPVPVNVSGLSNIEEIAAGVNFSMALRRDGRVFVWGASLAGDGIFATHSTPVMVAGLNDVVAISAGGAGAMALRADGTVWVWGDDLGDGGSAFVDAPKQLAGVSNIVSVAMGGSHGLVLKRDGTVWSWGYGGTGALGDYSTGIRATPAQVLFLTGATAIFASADISQAVKGDGTAWAWGGGGVYGRIGDGMAFDRKVPTPIQGIDLGAAVATPTLSPYGGDFLTAQTVTVACATAGATLRYTLNGTEPTAASATIASGGTLAIPAGITALKVKGFLAGSLASATKTGFYTIGVKLDAGADYSTVLTTDGKVWAWGLNTDGQLGYGTNLNEPTPTQIAGLSNITDVKAASTHTLALKSDGTVWSWGNNGRSQLGRATLPTNTPGQVTGLTGVRAIGIGEGVSYAIKTDGTLWAWGSNLYGQMGDGSLGGNRPTPAVVPGLANMVSIAAGASHTLALRGDGRVFAWGTGGLLGDGTDTPHETPIPVQKLSDIVAVQASPNGSIALKGDGTVWTWGAWDITGIGDAQNPNYHEPTQVTSISDIVSISMSNGHVLALRRDGIVFAWGDNTLGQIGNGILGQMGNWGTYDVQGLPIQVVGIPAAVNISASNHSLAVGADGLVLAWGYNSSFQLGDGTQVNRGLGQPVNGTFNTGKTLPIREVTALKDGYPDSTNMEFTFKAGYAGTVVVNIYKWKDPAVVKSINVGSVAADGNAVHVTWNSRDNAGNPVADGIYVPVIQLTSAGHNMTWGSYDDAGRNSVPLINPRSIVQFPDVYKNVPLIYQFTSDGWGRASCYAGLYWYDSWRSPPFEVHPGVNTFTFDNRDVSGNPVFATGTAFTFNVQELPWATPNNPTLYPALSFKVRRPSVVAGIRWGAYGLVQADCNVSNIEVNLNAPAGINAKYYRGTELVATMGRLDSLYAVGKSRVVWHSTWANNPDEVWLRAGDYQVTLTVRRQDGTDEIHRGTVAVYPPVTPDTATVYKKTAVALSLAKSGAKALAKTGGGGGAGQAATAPDYARYTLNQPMDYLLAFKSVDAITDPKVTMGTLQANGFATVELFLVSVKNALDLIPRDTLDPNLTMVYDRALKDYRGIVHRN